MKFTPGPWHWDSDPVKNDPTGRIRYRVTAVGKTITQTYYSSYEGGLTNAEADTRLISAAPELLEACQSLLKAIERHTGKIVALQDTPVAKARAAIQKATGE